jgi:hypothetical protein
MPQTVSPPDPACDKCGWPVINMSVHVRGRCNPVGGKAADELSAAALAGPGVRSTKNGHGQDKLTFVFDTGLQLVLSVDKGGRFRFDGFHFPDDYDQAGVLPLVEFLATWNQGKSP